MRIVILSQEARKIKIKAAAGNVAIIKHIAGWRAEYDLSAEEAAWQLGMSPSTFSRRKADPGNMTINEFRAMIRMSGATEQEIARMITGQT